MGSRSIDDEKHHDALALWRALRPDQRGAVYDGLAQLAIIAAAAHTKHARVIGDCPDLERTYRDTANAVGVASEVLRAVATAADVRIVAEPRDDGEI